MAIPSLLLGLVTAFACQVWQEYFKDAFADYLRRHPQKRQVLPMADDHDMESLVNFAPWLARNPVQSGLLAAGIALSLGRVLSTEDRHAAGLRGSKVAKVGFHQSRRIAGAGIRRLALMVEGNQLQSAVTEQRPQD